MKALSWVTRRLGLQTGCMSLVRVRFLCFCALVSVASSVCGGGLTTSVLFHQTAVRRSHAVDERLSLSLTISQDQHTSPPAMEFEIELRNAGPGDLVIANPMVLLGVDLRTSDGAHLGLASRLDVGFMGPHGDPADTTVSAFRLKDFGGFTFVDEERANVIPSRPQDVPLLEFKIPAGNSYSAKCAIEGMRVGGGFQDGRPGPSGKIWQGPIVAGPLVPGLYRLKLRSSIGRAGVETDWINVRVH